ncbi:MAG: hypothetical protein O3B47_01830 [bacterium]|nr:hypothetical protein [bacterium]
MSVSRYLFAGLVVGLLSVFYSFAVFSMFGFQPDLIFLMDFIELSNLDFYLVVFLKNFLVGVILTVLFSVAYRNIEHDMGGVKQQFLGIFFFILYAIFALISFSIGDIVLMRTTEGMLVLLTFDGIVEMIIATIPIRLFVLDL